MHEWGLVRAAVAELAQAAGEDAIGQVTVQTGPGVDPAVAATAWQTEVGRGSAAHVLAGAEVRWERAQDELSCLSCGNGYEGDALSPCPRCGANGLVVQPAPEVAIVQWTPAEQEPVGNGS